MSDTPKIELKTQSNPLLDSMPAYLKDPANFEKIQRAILETFQSTCSHSDLDEWAACKKCTEKMLERRHLLHNLGFKNPAQYMAWKKIHENIKARFPLVDWKKENAIRRMAKLNA